MSQPSHGDFAVIGTGSSTPTETITAPSINDAFSSQHPHNMVTCPVDPILTQLASDFMIEIANCTGCDIVGIFRSSHKKKAKEGSWMLSCGEFSINSRLVDGNKTLADCKKCGSCGVIVGDHFRSAGVMYKNPRALTNKHITCRGQFICNLREALSTGMNSEDGYVDTDESIISEPVIPLNHAHKNLIDTQISISANVSDQLEKLTGVNPNMHPMNKEIVKSPFITPAEDQSIFDNGISQSADSRGDTLDIDTSDFARSILNRVDTSGGDFNTASDRGERAIYDPSFCEFFGCHAAAYFNHGTFEAARFCATHKEDGMVRVRFKPETLNSALISSKKDISKKKKKKKKKKIMNVKIEGSASSGAGHDERNLESRDVTTANVECSSQLSLAALTHEEPTKLKGLKHLDDYCHVKSKRERVEVSRFTIDPKSPSRRSSHRKDRRCDSQGDNRSLKEIDDPVLSQSQSNLAHNPTIWLKTTLRNTVWGKLFKKIYTNVNELQNSMYLLDVVYAGGSDSNALTMTSEICKTRSDIKKRRQLILNGIEELMDVNKNHTRIEALALEDDDGMVDVENISCSKCNRNDCDDDDDVLFCDMGECNRAYHLACLDPPLSREHVSDDPNEDWFCWECRVLSDILMLINERTESDFISIKDVFTNFAEISSQINSNGFGSEAQELWADEDSDEDEIFIPSTQAKKRSMKENDDNDMESDEGSVFSETRDNDTRSDSDDSGDERGTVKKKRVARDKNRNSFQENVREVISEDSSAGQRDATGGCAVDSDVDDNDNDAEDDAWSDDQDLDSVISDDEVR